MRCLLQKSILVVLLLFTTLAFVSAEQTVKSIDLPLDYVASVPAATLISRNLTVDTPDGIAEILAFELVFRADMQPSTTVYGGIMAGQSIIFCDPQLWTSPAFATAGYEMSYDCTNLVQAAQWTGGTEPIELLWYNLQPVTNAKPRFRMTYYNKPTTNIQIFGTEYQVGDDMRMYLQLLDDEYQGVHNATCYADIYYPNKTIWHSDAIMSQLTADKSIYYYDLVAPNQLGVYMLTATCFYVTEELQEYGDQYIINDGAYNSGTLFDTSISNDNYLIFDDSFGVIDVELVFNGLNVSEENDEIDIVFEGKCISPGGNPIPNPDDNQSSINLSDIVMLHHFNNDSSLGENDSYFVDSSGFNNNGVCTAGVDCPIIEDGLFGNAVKHDSGADRIFFDNTTSLNSFGSEMTMGIWFKPQGSYTQWMLPISKGSGGWGDYSIGLNIDDGWALFHYTNSTGSGTWLGHYGTSLYDIDDWIFVAGTYNGTIATLYIATLDSDGFLLNKTSNGITGTLINDDSSVWKTGTPSGTGTVLEGVLDELFIFNRSLSMTEMEQLLDYTGNYIQENLKFEAYNYNTSTWDSLTNQQTCQIGGFDQTTGNTLINGLDYVNSTNSLKLKLNTQDYANFRLNIDHLDLHVPLYMGEQVDSIRGGGEFHVTDYVNDIIDEIDDVDDSIDDIENQLDDINDTLNDINTTVNGIQNYLTTTILPEIDNVEEDLLNVLNNQTTILNAITGLNFNTSGILSELDTLKSMVQNTNSTLYTEIIDNQNKLIILNNTANLIYSYITTNQTAQYNDLRNLILSTNTTVNAVQTYLTNTIFPEIDNVEEDLTNILNNHTNIYNKLLELETDIETNYNELQTARTMISNVNSTLITEIDQNEAKLDTIDSIIDSILNNITTIIIPQLNGIDGNISSIQSDLTTIENYVDTLETGQTQILGNLSVINTNILDLDSDIVSLRSNMTANFDQVDSTLSTISTEVTNIENKLDCTHTTNVICDRLTSINNTVLAVQSTVDDIETYLTVNLTADILKNYNAILNVNSTIYDYLVNTILPEIDNVEEDITNILNNQSVLLSAINNLDFNTSGILSELNNLKSMIQDTNSTLYNEIIITQNRLTNLNITIEAIKSYQELNLTSKIDNLQSDVTNILTNQSVINNNILDIENNSTAIYNKLLEIESQLTAVNSSILAEINQVQANLIVINNTANLIYSYVTTNQTAQYNDLKNLIISTNTTVNGVQTYLTTTILPEIDNVEEDLTNVLNNQTTILNAINDISLNTSDLTSDLTIIKSMIQNTNSTLITEINENEAKLDIIDLVVDSILLNITNVLDPKLDSIQSNITDIQSDLSTIELYVDSLESGQTQILGNLSVINTNILDLDSDIVNLRSNMTANFDQVDSVLSSINTEVTNIENKLDCTHTQNVICDRLTSINNTVNGVQTTVNSINSYLTINLTADILKNYNAILSTNTTVTTVQSYLTNTILPEIDNVEEDLTNVLNNQTVIYNKLLTIETDVDTNYNEILNIQSALSNVNTSINAQISTILSRLALMNSTIEATYSYLVVNVSARFDSIDTDLTNILLNQTNIWNKLNDISINVTDQQANFDLLQSLIINTNSTLLTEINNNEAKLDIIDSIVDSILSNITVEVIPKIDSVQSNLSVVLTELNNIELAVDNVSSEVQTISSNIVGINSSLFDLRNNFTTRFDTIDSNIAAVQTEVTNIEHKLDCNHTVNIVCDKLDSISTDISTVDSVVDSIDTYLTTTVASNLSTLYNLAFDTNLTVFVNNEILRDINSTIIIIQGTVNNINSTVENISVDTQRISQIYEIVNETVQFKSESTSRVVATNQYAIRTTFVDINGQRIDPDARPTVTLTDPLNNVVASGINMTKNSVGVYTYTYNTSSSSNTGNWLTTIDSTYLGNQFYQYDYWNLISNPTQITVTVQKACNDVCAEILIQNEGTTPYEYIYYWWTTDDALEDYSGATVIDRGQASKLINPGEIYTVTQCLTIPPTDSQHYFRTKVYYGEYSYATDSWTGDLNCVEPGSKIPTTFAVRELEPTDFSNIGVGLTAIAVVILVLFLIFRKREDDFKFVVKEYKR